jgi:nucleoside 2-deoxyribosyltransferase
VGRRVYLAGFDVFRQDAADYGRALKALCATFGLHGIYPLDSEVPVDLSPGDQAAWIYRANIEAIRACNLVMANVDDFRGPGEVDSGTAFETGFAAALGKPVWAYTRDAGTLVERVPHVLGVTGAVCERGFLVEDFGLSKNLMIACSATIIHGDARTCLEAIVCSMSGPGTPSPVDRVANRRFARRGKNANSVYKDGWTPILPGSRIPPTPIAHGRPKRPPAPTVGHSLPARLPSTSRCLTAFCDI